MGTSIDKDESLYISKRGHKLWYKQNFVLTRVQASALYIQPDQEVIEGGQIFVVLG